MRSGGPMRHLSVGLVGELLSGEADDDGSDEELPPAAEVDVPTADTGGEGASGWCEWWCGCVAAAASAAAACAA